MPPTFLLHELLEPISFARMFPLIPIDSFRARFAPLMSTFLGLARQSFALQVLFPREDLRVLATGTFKANVMLKKFELLKLVRALLWEL
jgi:hypothetical protein